MKKKFLCLFLGIWLCLSFALPLYALGGPINADDNAELVRPTLEVTNTPAGAAAIACDLLTGQTHYYRINGDILSNNDNEILSEPGWVPPNASINEVIGSDNRAKVEHTQYYPYSAIAYLHISFPNGNSFGGTAALISPNVALTAAHCVYDPSLDDKWANYIEVYPGTSGPVENQSIPYGMALVSEIVISIPAFEDGNWGDGADCDWAVLYLTNGIDSDAGYFGFRTTAPDWDTQTMLISGYPDDENGYRSGNNFIYTHHDQYKHSGTIDIHDEAEDTAPIIANNGTSYQSTLYSYQIDATEGQSGAPILYEDNNTYDIIGIHSAGVDEVRPFGIYERNRGFAITTQLYHFLVAYKYNCS